MVIHQHANDQRPNSKEKVIVLLTIFCMRRENEEHFPLQQYVYLLQGKDMQFKTMKQNGITYIPNYCVAPLLPKLNGGLLVTTK